MRCIRTPVDAQSAEEREAMSDSVNAENLRRLSAEFQKDFERREAPNGGGWLGD